MTAEQTPKAILMSWSAAFKARDIDALMALYAEDAVNHQVAEAPLLGKAAIRASFLGFFQAFPDEQTEAIHFLEDDEWAIWEWRGWSPGDPARTTLHGCGFFHVRAGKIVLQRGYWDKLTFLRAHQLPLDAAVGG